MKIIKNAVAAMESQMTAEQIRKAKEIATEEATRVLFIASLGEAMPKLPSPTKDDGYR